MIYAVAAAAGNIKNAADKAYIIDYIEIIFLFGSPLLQRVADCFSV